MNVDGERLWGRLMAMAEVGSTPAGGSNRQALSNEDQAGRDLFVRWCMEAGCTVATDSIGNLFATRTGSDPKAPPVVLASHLDTQPTGGRFDGVYGVLGGLEVVETLNDRGVTTVAPVEVGVWTNEEGSRFPVSMMGSATWSGVLSVDDARSLTDIDGVSVGDELDRLGWAGPLGLGRGFGHYLELHIEQGPILEANGRQIGIVEGVQGLRWFRIAVNGFPSHAGPTPMDVRRDPARPVAEILAGVYELASKRAPSSRATIAQFLSHPVSPNTVPAFVEFSVDIRHPDDDVLDSMEAELRTLVEAAAARHHCSSSIERVNASPAVHFDDRCVEAVLDSTEAAGFTHQRITSGAGHDACHVAPLCPAGMIFIPCENGLSHNEAESIEPADAARGAEVLYRSALRLAGTANP